MIENINKRTGEVIEFFTKHTYTPDVPESYKDVVSAVDATSHEPLETMVKRVLRGQIIPRSDIYYDEHEDVTATPGFDLADTGDVLADVSEQLNAGAGASEEQLTADANASADKQAQQTKTESPSVSEDKTA